MEGGEVVLLIVEFLEHSLYGAERVLQLRIAAFSSTLGRAGLVITARPIEQRHKFTFRSGQAVLIDILGLCRRRGQEVRKIVMSKSPASSCQFLLGLGGLRFNRSSERIPAIGLALLCIRNSQD